jgi:phenylacetate-CoA ligase
VDWAWALVEPETDGAETSILVTKLHADGMPLIRYRVGDLGAFPAGSRPGHPTFVLQGVLGRELDRLWLPDGKWISGAQFPHLLKSFAVREFMLVQASNYDVELQIVPKNGFDAAQQREVLQTIQANLEDVPVTLKMVRSIERTRANKWRPVVSEVRR